MTTAALTPERELIFGPSPVEPEEIVRLLREKVTEDTVRQYLKSLDPSYNGDPSEKDKGWKEVIFRTLEEGLVVKYGGQEVYTRPERKEKEFLLDFVWLNQDETNAYRSAFLGVEVEWWKGRKELLRNFRKLLFFKAPQKLLVYSCLDGCSEEDRAAEREELRNCLEKFERHVEDECYLLVEFVKKDDESMKRKIWKQEARIWRAKRGGPEEEVKLGSVEMPANAHDQTTSQCS